MIKRLKTPPHPNCKFIRGRRGRDVIRVNLPSGGVGFIATTIPLSALKAFAKSLTRKIAKRKRLARAQGHQSTPAKPIEGDEDPGAPDAER